MFMYKKFMSLGSPTLVQRAWRTKYVSIRKASQIAKISCSLTRLVLKNDLGLKPYKKPDLHEIETNDYPTHIWTSY
jgi:hypothetical protein